MAEVNTGTSAPGSVNCTGGYSDSALSWLLLTNHIFQLHLMIQINVRKIQPLSWLRLKPVHLTPGSVNCTGGYSDTTTLVAVTCNPNFLIPFDHTT